MNKTDARKYVVIVLGLFLLAAFVAGCGATVRADSAVAQTTADTPDFVGVLWQWQETQSSDDTTLTVDDPSRYTVEFAEDGSASIKADCNMVSWTYTVDGSSLSFNTVGPATLAACPPDSLADVYLQQLGATASYVMDGDNLVLNMMADGGNMIFAPAGAEPPATEAGSGAETESPNADIIATFHALLPSDTSPGRYVTLVADEDGSVALSIDYLNGQDPEIQSGTWERDQDLVTITITEKDGEALDEPVVVTFRLDGDRLVAEDYDVTFYGATGLPLSRRVAAALSLRDAKRPLLKLDLEAGFPLDPFFVSVNGGGELDASTLGEGCQGFVHHQPVLSVDWSGQTDLAQIFFYSDHDPTLVIQTPDGEYLCNDDANPLLLDPVIKLKDPAPGTYNIWVGSFRPNQLLPGVLVITTHDDINVGEFSLAGLVKREPIPELLQTPEGQAAAQRLLEALDRYENEVGALSPSEQNTATVAVTSAGDIPAFESPLVGDRCSGYIGDTPDYLFDWVGAAEQLAVYFEGDGDASLVVITPDQQILCNDDALPGENVNPLVLVNDPAKGRYAVWVGRIHPDAPVTGDLTVTSLSEAQPVVLAPAVP